MKVNSKKDVIGTTAEFLGIEIDTIHMEARLPQEKLTRAQEAVRRPLSKPAWPRKELESLTGYLAFASKVVPPGRAFLRRLYNALARDGSHIHLDIDTRRDLQWWDAYLTQWNGIRLLRITASRQTLHIYTDASGTKGMGGWIVTDPPDPRNARDAFALNFHTAERKHDIQYKEMRALLFAIRSWRPRLASAYLVMYCDNKACVDGLAKTSVAGSGMIPLREVVLLCAMDDIALHLIYIPGKLNILADDLSRFRFQKIADEFPLLQIRLQKNHPQSGMKLPT